MLFLASCSDEYDDSQIRKDILDLKDRIEKLETQAKTVNADLETLNSLVGALQGKVYIAKVEQNADGYTIYFTDGTTARITNGEDGEDAPVIGVKAENGIYYWTMTSNGVTTWLTDAAGDKLRADAVTPQLGVDAQGYWTISYDGGATSTRVLDAEGNPVEALSGIFHGVSDDGAYLNVTLADGTTISVPISSNFYLLITDAPEVAEFEFGQTRTFAVESVGVERTVLTKPDEWKVSLADNVLTITAPAKEHEACADLEGEVSIIYSSANFLTTSVSMKVAVAEPKTIDIAIKDKGIGYGSYEGETATITARITPSDDQMLYYYSQYRPSTYETDDPEEVVATHLESINYFISTQGGWDEAVKVFFTQGPQEYVAKFLYEDEDYYIIAFGVKKAVVDGAETAVATTQLFRSELVHTLALAPADDSIDLSADGTSNSYIVNKPNTLYKFKATVMGNGKATAGITPQSIDPKKAIILWETGTVKNAIIKEVELTTDGYVKFTTGETMDGNAVIAVTDGVPVENQLDQGTVLWSWHIWATDYAPEMDQTVTSFAGKEFTMMNVNLGEWSNKSTSYSSGFWGLKYQWGRKDPFISFTSYGTAPDGVTHYSDYPWETGSITSMVASDEESIRYAVQYPCLFILGSYNTDNDWYGTAAGAEGRNNDLWGNADGAAVKTIYDPCPVGYKVAPQEAFTGFSKIDPSTSVSVTSNNMNVSGSFNGGWNFITSGGNTIFFPAAGMLNATRATVSNVNYNGYYHTSTPDLESAQSRMFRLERVTFYYNSTDRAAGCSVRCVRE